MQLHDVRRTNTAVASSSHRLPAFHHAAVVFCAALACLSSQHSMLAQAAPPSLPLDPLPGQPKFATVSLGLGKVVSPRRHKIVFEQIGVQPRQVVTVALQYPIALAGTVVAAEPLDGGRIVPTGQPLAVAADGTLSFSYEAGGSPGLYQIRLHYDEEAIALQFWVFDAAHPENNPSVLMFQ